MTGVTNYYYFKIVKYLYNNELTNFLRSFLIPNTFLPNPLVPTFCATAREKMPITITRVLFERKG